MSARYLGDQFDIHGGGMDLLFPHHESEIAQSTVCHHKTPARYWLHNNMITINGQKMGKSLGNFITLDEFFTGSHQALEKAYSPMTIRFFILMAHYRSPLDFSNEALQAAEKGLARLMKACVTLEKLQPGAASTSNIAELESNCYQAMNDDLNSPILIANLFEAVRIINSVFDRKENITADDLQKLKALFHNFIFEILGLMPEQDADSGNLVVDGLMNLILEIRAQARANKDWATSDKIRDELARVNITLKDTKEGAAWEMS
jgi:cysteinyl-tRNA synthetase